MKIEEVIVGPVLTEKATNLAQGQVYTFNVHKNATKHTIKDALERLYPVKIAKISVANRKGKTRRIGKKMTTKMLPNRKIAYVIVKEGKIDLFPKI